MSNTDPMSGSLTLFIQVERLIHISQIGIAWYGTVHLVIYGSHVERYDLQGIYVHIDKQCRPW